MFYYNSCHTHSFSIVDERILKVISIPEVNDILETFDAFALLSWFVSLLVNKIYTFFNRVITVITVFLIVK